jgi:hypothetical protein
VALSRERAEDEEGGFARPWLLMLTRMEVILLFQLGENFAFWAGLVGVDSGGGTVMG